MKRKRFIHITAICAVMVLCFVMISGCGQGNSKDVRIFICLNKLDAFRQTVLDAAIARAAEQGVQLDMGDSEGSVETQVSLLKEAAAQDYDVIICGPVSTNTVTQLKMSVGETPIVFVNTCPEDKYLEAGKYVYVGSSEQVAGEFQGEYVLERLADKQEINVVLLKGPKEHSGTKGRTRGAKKVLESSGKQINYVFEDNANWDMQKAKKLFKLFLQTGTEVDCVICNNDSMGLGVVEACKESGIDCGTLPILGVDATADGCAAIRSGDMAFTVYQSGSGQGKAAIDMAIKLARKEKTKDMEGITEDEKYVWVDFERVDSSNVSQYE